MLLNRFVQMALGLAGVAALASQQGEVAAATLEVSATVPNSCTVESGTLEFGEYQAGPSASSVQENGTFNVQCTTPAEVGIKLNGGLHEGLGENTRAMKGPGENYLDYVLYYQQVGQEWAPEVSIPVQLQGGGNPITVVGVIDSNQTVPSGEYTDSVEITLVFN